MAPSARHVARDSVSPAARGRSRDGDIEAICRAIVAENATRMVRVSGGPPPLSPVARPEAWSRMGHHPKHVALVERHWPAARSYMAWLLKEKKGCMAVWALMIVAWLPWLFS